MARPPLGAGKEKPLYVRFQHTAKKSECNSLLELFGQEGNGVNNAGAGDRIRTGDIDLGKVALYQLSYSRPTRNHYAETSPVLSNGL